MRSCWCKELDTNEVVVVNCSERQVTGDKRRKEKGVGRPRALNGRGEVASSFAALPTRSATRLGARKRGEDTAATVNRERRRKEKLRLL
jgi:hypothetical protein